ncbi:MAG: hypothetical protein WDN03_12990 [Rhizomicrobium sp.]
MAVRAGEAAGREIRDVDRIEGAPFCHVGKIDDAFEDAVEADAAFLQHGGDVLHHLAALRFDAAGHKLHLAGQVADGAREIEHAVRLDRLAERQPRRPGGR